MQFQPKTEKEIQEKNLWQPGTYDFEIKDAEDQISKAGNDMIYLKLLVFNDDSRMKFVDDYLLEILDYKLRHAAEACGLVEKYESGELHGLDFEGKAGKVKIGIEKSKDPQYSDKNKVTDYVVDKGAIDATTPIDSSMDDGIPF